MSLPRLFALSVFAAPLASWAEHHQLDTVVITAPPTSSVLIVTTDTKAARQPVPAQDGADLLKNIPGFSVVRKGGTDGDPMFRGMAASRLNILLDGETILGGCGSRMDPPTAYIFPESFDSVTVIKGPQSVKYGAGSAGIVMFERTTPDFTNNSLQGYISYLSGSFGRTDQTAQIQAGGSKGYISLNGTHTHSGNYKNGDGDEVHSAYTRYNGNAALGWTPNTDTRIELSAAKSDGEARYADRSMDGVTFDRTSFGLSYEQKHISPLISKINARIYRNYVDHVMDNYSLRDVSGMHMVANPDRETLGAILNSQWLLTDALTIDLGVDHQKNNHSLRSTTNYEQLPRIEDMRFENSGAYIESKYAFLNGDSVHLGARINYEQAQDLRTNKTTSHTANDHWLRSGFMRYEHQWSNVTRIYAGLGHSERAADYWERTRNPNATSGMMTGNASTFDINPEKTTQIDIGAIYQTQNTNASISAFMAEHNDYILIESLTPFATDARSIRAKTMGLEADIIWRLHTNWSTLLTAAWVYGENSSEHIPLGQMPAPEMRVGLNYDNQVFSAGVLWRLVVEQDRVAPKQGNIVGQDIDKSPSFDVFSVFAGVRIKSFLLTAGIDNVFDTNYAEHISRSGATIAGYETMLKVDEPGRNLWLKAQLSF